MTFIFDYTPFKFAIFKNPRFTIYSRNGKFQITLYDGVDSLKQILVLSTFQFTRFQPTELNSLLVSTR